jgi:hypothetical protein
VLRFQTKSNPSKEWKDPGPDLLRTRKNAKARIKDDLAEYGAGWYVRIKVGENPWKAWTGPHERAEILDAFQDWNPKDQTYAQWGRKPADGKVEAKGAVRARVIDVPHRSGCTENTDKVVAILEAGFPAGVYGGTMVCKQISGSSSWSQHAYGRAYDHSCYEKNDAGTDYAIRLARENREDDIQLPVWQILGSRDGRAGVADNGDGDWIGDFGWSFGGCDSSHEWHIHVSTGKSKASGTPSCASKSLSVDPPVEEHDATDAEEE